MTTFASLGLSPKILTALEKTTLKTPTPIQAQAIPHIMKGRDLMGLAQTGTGKTAAFGLPLLHRILDIGHPPGPKMIRALILAPTRELALQIKDHLETFTKGTPVKVLMVVGGAWINRQTASLSRGADVLVATPGRLLWRWGSGWASTRACSMWIGSSPRHRPYPVLRALWAVAAAEHWSANRVRDELNFGRRYSGAQADDAMYRFALETVRAHPVAFAGGTVRQWVWQIAAPGTGVHSCPSGVGRYLCSGRAEGESLPGFPNVPARRSAVRPAVVRFV